MVFTFLQPGSRIRRRAIAATALLIALTFISACRQHSPDARPAGATPIQNLLFISLDTTRADHIGCYGYAAAKTPAIDALAARGTRFNRAYSQVPLTLPSHATMMTGRYPRELGVRDNGRDAVNAAELTLAELAKQAGLRTGAFLSAFVLDSRFGLSQGFETYDDEMTVTTAGAHLLELERRGDLTTDRALKWLAANDDKPFFCWVHLYDPHHPYQPPEPFATQLADPYDGEIAFADTQVARLIDALNASGRLEQTLIVVIGDHGESFGEHGDEGHSIFVYDTNLHVPLIVAGPGIATGHVCRTPVEVVDIFPTLCELAGWKPKEGLLSLSLAPALHGQPMEPIACYAESQFAYNTYRYAEQRSITTDRWKYISSTRPELYDLRADAGEKTNVLADHADVVSRMSEFLALRYDQMKPGVATAVPSDDKAQQALKSLGYVGGSRDVDTALLTPGLPDPKDMLPVIRALAAAREKISAGKLTEALDLLTPALKQSPSAVEILTTIATCQIELGHQDRAVESLQRALKIEPENPAALEAMGDLLFNAGQFDQAEKHYAAAVGNRMHDAKVLYKHGLALKRLNRAGEAADEFELALREYPGYVEAAAELLSLPPSPAGASKSAVAILEALAREHPGDGAAQMNFGVALMGAGDFAGATKQFMQAVRLDPALGSAYNKLGICAARNGAREEATQWFRKATEFPESRPEGFYNLGVTAEKAGAVGQAIEYYRQAIDANPGYAAAIVAQTSLLLRASRVSEAVQVLKAGAAACPGDIRILSSLANILATNPDDAVRDGASAIALAQQASKLTGDQHPQVLGILAAAYAESGQFDLAVETGDRAIALANSAGATDLVAQLETQVSLYRNHKPYRESRP